MEYQSELVKREIDQTKLPKKAQAILQKCGRLVKYYRSSGTGVRNIHITADDYDLLAAAMEKTNQKLQERTYQGFGLVK